MRHFKPSLLLFLFIALSNYTNSTSAASAETEVSYDGILLPMTSSLPEDMDASTAPAQFQRFRDHSATLMGQCAHAVATMHPTEVPMGRRYADDAHGTHFFALHTAYKAFPSIPEQSIAQAIARGIAGTPATDIETILREHRLSDAEQALWLLLWKLRDDSTCDPLIVRDAAGKRDYLATLRTVVGPVFKAYRDPITSAAS